MADRAALIAVYDKTGAVDLARGLAELGYDLLSTGGTARTLRRARLRVVEVADVTRFPEILGGRVKTLHPKIFGGLLARDTAGHRRQLRERRIKPIDVVAVNLYPFEETLRRRGVTTEEAVEQIDVGGVALLRAGAKNFERVVVLSAPDQYEEALERLREGTADLAWRRELARRAFARTANYDVAIANYLGGSRGRRPGEHLLLYGEKVAVPPYGENPHQKAAFYGDASAGLRQLAGPPPSFNNFLDLAAAVDCVRECEAPACVVVKHNSPCGAAVAATPAEAFRRAWEADPLSAFGGIVAFNRPVNEEAAAAMMTKGIYFHLCAAPSYRAGVVEYLRTAKRWTERLRIFAGKYRRPGLEYRSILGGLLAQEVDRQPAARDRWEQVAGPTVEEEEVADLRFAWTVAKYARSNAVVVAKEGRTLAIGAGSVNRLWPAEDAVRRVGAAARGAVAASDGFFPKPDTPEVLCRAGVRAIVQPAGSKGDHLVVELAQRYGVALFFAERRHFRH
ncbi:MAG: bifunctional phosphoribosylaminoimidazolecarboxamide formyltransferase/IMP cyclohydrolase [Candidatus Coatesbacteria bacterium]|nr:MAG: bifunctional phosphoribosylaminoimidazolecarboxamide formyltransferase/IMP cyclohydrolase [Candidatus Coatesbacteria bacterium]